MFFIPIEELSNGLTFVRGQSCDIHKCLHPLVIHRSNYSACVCVTNKNHRTLRTAYCALQCRGVIAD